MGCAALKVFAPRAVFGGGAIEYFLQPRRVFGRLLRDGHSSTGVHATYISSHILQRMYVLRYSFSCTYD